MCHSWNAILYKSQNHHFRQLFLPQKSLINFWGGITSAKSYTPYWQHFASPRSQQICHFCRVLQTASKWFSWEKTQRGEGLRWKASPGLLAVKRRRCASAFERFTHQLPGRRWWWTKEQSLTSVIGGVRKRESSQRWRSCFSHTIPSPPALSYTHLSFWTAGDVLCFAMRLSATGNNSATNSTSAPSATSASLWQGGGCEETSLVRKCSRSLSW